jgi:hypothetical protein
VASLAVTHVTIDPTRSTPSSFALKSCPRSNPRAVICVSKARTASRSSVGFVRTSARASVSSCRRRHRELLGARDRNGADAVDDELGRPFDDLRFDSRACRQEVHDDAARRTQPNRREAPLRVVFDDGERRVTRRGEVAHQRLEVDVAREPHLSTNGDRQPSDERERAPAPAHLFGDLPDAHGAHGKIESLRLELSPPSEDEPLVFARP